MCKDNRNITINILPQSSEAWFCIALAVAVFSVASCAKTMEGANAVQIAKIQADAEIAKAKILSESKK